MDQKTGQYTMWSAIAGIILLSVAIYNTFLSSTANGSTFIQILLWIAALGFILNAFLMWRRAH